MKNTAILSVTRNSSDQIMVSVRDEGSRITVCELRLTPEQFALSVTGLVTGGVAVEYGNLQHVGKTKIREKRQIACDFCTMSRPQLETWLAENAREDGWIVDNYLRSQGSVEWRDGIMMLNYSVYRYA